MVLLAPIPLFAIAKLLYILIQQIIKEIPKTKDTILQERYFANRKLLNFNQQDQQTNDS